MTSNLFSIINDYIKDNESDFENNMFQLDKLLVTARDRGSVPIYATKGRIKTPDSVYLKTKRRDLDDHLLITDYIGFRVLCLFQQDIFFVHSFLNEMFFDTKAIYDRLGQTQDLEFKLEKLNIYTWPEEDTNRIRESTKSKASSSAKHINWLPLEKDRDGAKGGKLQYMQDDGMSTLVIRETPKPSGYKAIHYVGKLNGLNLEIQLRTLIQDVWGELEHNLIYKKGHIHPHLADTSRMVAKSLENTDNLINHLREIREQQQHGEKFGSHLQGPYYCFAYDQDFFDAIADSDETRQQLYDYWQAIKSSVSLEAKENALVEAKKMFAILETKLGDNWQSEYFKDMERVYLESPQ